MQATNRRKPKPSFRVSGPMGMHYICLLRCFFHIVLLVGFTQYSYSNDLADESLDITRLTGVWEVFDGGSVRFDFETKTGPLKIVLSDQNILKENQVKNPEYQRIYIVKEKNNYEIKPDTSSERNLVRELSIFAAHLSNQKEQAKIKKLILVIRDRKTPPIEKDFWYW